MAEIIWKPEPTPAEVQEEKIEQIRREAYRLLQPTDWMIVRRAETGEEAPQDVLAYRQAVRDATDVAEVAILELADMEAVRAYEVEWPERI